VFVLQGQLQDLPFLASHLQWGQSWCWAKGCDTYSWVSFFGGQDYPTQAANHDGSFEMELQMLGVEVGGMMSPGAGAVRGAAHLLLGVGVAGAVLPL